MKGLYPIATPRPKDECIKEFEEWLANSCLSRGDTWHAVANEIQGHYLKAKAGCTDVDCFCGKPALNVRPHPTTAPAYRDVKVAMCWDHLNEYDAARRKINDMSNEIHKAQNPKVKDEK